MSLLDHEKAMSKYQPMRTCNGFHLHRILEIFSIIRRLKNISHAQVYSPSPKLMIQNRNWTTHQFYIYFLLFVWSWSCSQPGSEFWHYLRAALTNVPTSQPMIQLSKTLFTYHVNPKRCFWVLLLPFKSFHIGEFSNYVKYY